MKRMTALFLAVLLSVFLSACQSSHSEQQPENPVTLYFIRESVTHGTEDGVLAPQVADLGETSPDVGEFLRFYLDTAPGEGLTSPFPEQLQILNISLENNILALQLGGAYADLSGIQATLADACLAKTLLLYTGADKLLLSVADTAGQTLRSGKITEGDILIFDDSSDTSTLSLTFYFTDANARYLISERRTVPYLTDAELPKYIVNQLIAGPETNGLQKTLPQGTRLLDINVDNGICSVDFSADFWNNRPQTAAEERLALLSVVNSLTELDSIEQVQFYVEGRRQEQYCFLSLAEPFTADTTAIGPARGDLNETDVTVWLPVENSGLLYPVPLRLKTGSVSSAQAVLQALCDYEPKNGLSNPLFHQVLPDKITVENHSCTLEYPAGTVFGDSAEAELAALRMLTVAMTEAEGVTDLTVLVGGVPAASQLQDLPTIWQPRADWYCQSPAS